MSHVWHNSFDFVPCWELKCVKREKFDAAKIACRVLREKKFYILYELWINDTWVFIFALARQPWFCIMRSLEKTCIMYVYFYLDRVFHLPCTVRLRLCCRVTLDYSVWFVVQIKGAVLRRNEKPPGQSECVIEKHTHQEVLEGKREFCVCEIFVFTLLTSNLSAFVYLNSIFQ